MLAGAPPSLAPHSPAILTQPPPPPPALVLCAAVAPSHPSMHSAIPSHPSMHSAVFAGVPQLELPHSPNMTPEPSPLTMALLTASAASHAALKYGAHDGARTGVIPLTPSGLAVVSTAPSGLASASTAQSNGHKPLPDQSAGSAQPTKPTKPTKRGLSGGSKVPALDSALDGLPAAKRVNVGESCDLRAEECDVDEAQGEDGGEAAAARPRAAPPPPARFFSRD